MTLQGIHDAINALGGSDVQNNSYDQGIVDTVAKALEIIEKAQAEETSTVKAVNAHDALVKALEYCLREHGGFTIRGECEKNARAALALAKGAA